MEVKILSQENGMATLQVLAPAELLTRALDENYNVFKKNHPQTQLTREAITTDEAGQTLYRQSVQDILSDCYNDVIAQSGLRVASEPQIAVMKADEESGVEYHISFALRPEIKLGQYKGIHVKMPVVTLTQEDVNAAYELVSRQNAEPVAVDRPAQLGDIATIDFVGYLGGVPFEGGAGNGYPLTLGSGTFIPGFEEQLVGARVGDHVAVNVTFPENYQAEELAGQAVLFRVTVNKLETLVPAVLTDEQKAEIRQMAQQQKQSEADAQIEDTVLKHILDEAQVTIPEAMVSSEVKVCMEQFAAQVQAQGMQLEAYAQRIGKSVAEMALEMQPLATRRIMLRLVLSAIAEAENLVATDEEVNAQWEGMAKQYGMPIDQVKAYAGEGAEASIRAEIASQKAYALLRESTILDQ